MSKLFKKVLPVAAAFIPGVGPLASAALGAGLGAIGGGGLKGALLGGLGGYVGAGGLGNSIGAATGLTGASLSAATKGLGGAITGASGGLKSALLGGLSSGVGGYAQGGGFGQAAGTSLDAATGKSGMQGPTMGSGTMGAVTRNIGGLNAVTAPNASGGLSSGDLITKGISAYNDYTTTDDAEKKLLAAQGKMESTLSPYLSAGTSGINALQSGFDPSQIESDAGYQFRLQQGQDALEKAIAARGMSGSGAALKALQDYGQGQAAQAYNDAYNQWYQKNAELGNYGQNAARSINDVYGTIGDIQANALVNKRKTINELLANVLRG